MKDQAKGTDFRDTEEANFKRGVQLRDQGRLEEAVEVFRGMATRHPREAASFVMLGGLYNEMGRPDEAASSYRQAVRLSPRIELANRGLFNALWTLGREDEAITLIREYKELTGSDAFDDIISAYELERG